MRPWSILIQKPFVRPYAINCIQPCQPNLSANNSMDYNDTIFQRFVPHHNQILHLDLLYYNCTCLLNSNLFENISHQMVCLHSLDSGNRNLSNLVNPQSSNSKKAIKVFGIISFNVHIHGITRAFRPRWVLTDIPGIIVLANTFCYATRGFILPILKNFRGSKMRFNKSR